MTDKETLESVLRELGTQYLREFEVKYSESKAGTAEHRISIAVEQELQRRKRLWNEQAKEQT